MKNKYNSKDKEVEALDQWFEIFFELTSTPSRKFVHTFSDIKLRLNQGIRCP